MNVLYVAQGLHHAIIRMTNNANDPRPDTSISSEGSNSSSSISHVGNILHILEQLVRVLSRHHPCISHSIVYCDLLNLLDLPVEATCIQVSHQQLPLVLLKAKNTPLRKPMMMKKKRMMMMMESNDHIDVNEYNDYNINKDVVSGINKDDSSVVNSDDASGVVSVSNDRDKLDVTSSSTMPHSRTNNNDSNIGGIDRVVDIDNNSHGNSLKAVIMETMSTSICNKGKQTSPLFHTNDPNPHINLSTTTPIEGRRSLHPLDYVPGDVNKQKLVGRWVSIDLLDDNHRFQEVVVRYDDKYHKLIARKIDGNDFIRSNEVSWMIDLPARSIRVGASYSAQVHVSLPNNVEPEFEEYSFKLHALPASTFLSRSEYQLHYDQQSSSSPSSSPISTSEYYEIELEVKRRDGGKRASRSCDRISFCRSIDFDRCLLSVSRFGVTPVTPVNYLKIVERYDEVIR